MGVRGARALGLDAGLPRGVTGELSDECSRLFEGRVGLAAGRSGFVKKLVVFLARTPLGLRCGRPGLRAPRGSVIGETSAGVVQIV